jgi:hypothetical protein
MKNKLPQWEARYARLRDQFKNLGWISEGYVQNRGPGAGGPCYQWTRKVRGKTVSVALSREVLFATVPHPPRRKQLGKKVLGLI